MAYRRTSTWKTVDWPTILLYLLLVVAGWFSIYAASYDFDQTSMVDLSGRAGQQMLWIATSLGLAFILLMIDSDWYDVFAYWIYGFIILLLIATVFLAPDIKGSRSWLVIVPGVVQVQPAEFAKFATALAVAKLLSSYRFELLRPANFLKVLLLIGAPMLLILMQKETGSALVFLALAIVLYREGMSGTVILSAIGAILFFVLLIRYDGHFWGATPVGELVVFLLIIIIAFVVLYLYKRGRHHFKLLLPVLFLFAAVGVGASFFYPVNYVWVALAYLAFLTGYLLVAFLKYRATHYLYILLFAVASIGFVYSVDFVFDKILEPHQRIRIQVTLGIVDDPSGAGYNVNQSKIAIGSGGFTGKGFLNGTQTKLKYVPEQDTDFIFCTIGEEKGFVGTTTVLLLFVVLILRLVYLAERQKSIFHRVYGYSVASILFFHLAINIGMVIGITPVIGIPLPFFSYGGSSLWAFTILLFIFLRLDASRNDRL